MGVDDLKALLCCAWEHLLRKEAEKAEKDDAVSKTTNNRDLIKKKVESDEASLAARLEARAKKVKCSRCGPSSR